MEMKEPFKNCDKSAGRLEYLFALHRDLRGEIRDRIAQRDRFAVQFLVAVCAVVSVSIMGFKYAPFFAAFIPVVAIFYFVQISYSYAVHNGISEFLRNHVEPEIARLVDVPAQTRHGMFWETRWEFLRKIRGDFPVGIRQRFFEAAMFVSPFIFLFLFLALVLDSEHRYSSGLVYPYAIFVFAAFACVAFWIKRGFPDGRVRASFAPRQKFDSGDPIELCNKYKFSDRAVFIDRDGTLIVDKIQPKNPSEIEFFPDTFESLREIQSKGYRLIIATNQDGIRHGKLTEDEFFKFNARLRETLAGEGIYLDAIYYSPYESKDGHFSFKPNPGMLFQAAEDFRLDMRNSYMIGDRPSDYMAALRAGARPLLVGTGTYSAEEKIRLDEFARRQGLRICSGLREAASLIPPARQD